MVAFTATSKFCHDNFPLHFFVKSLVLFENNRGQVKNPMLFFYLLFTAHCVMMHWKSHSQVFTRLDDAGERRWATAANPTQGRRNVGNFGGPIIKKTAFDQFFLVRAKEPDQPNPNLTRTLHAGGQLDSILDPEDPTRLEIGFKLDSFGFILKVHFYVEPNFESFFRSIQFKAVQLVYSTLRDQLDLIEP